TQGAIVSYHGALGKRVRCPLAFSPRHGASRHGYIDRGERTGRRKTVLCKKHGLLIGRNPKNDLAIPQDVQVSGSHAYLHYDKGGLLIIDRNSRNGTFVNENKLTDTGCVLNSGDRIRVGNSTFEVRITSS